MENSRTGRKHKTSLETRPIKLAPLPPTEARWTAQQNFVSVSFCGVGMVLEFQGKTPPFCSSGRLFARRDSQLQKAMEPAPHQDIRKGRLWSPARAEIEGSPLNGISKGDFSIDPSMTTYMPYHQKRLSNILSVILHSQCPVQTITSHLNYFMQVILVLEVMSEWTFSACIILPPNPDPLGSVTCSHWIRIGQLICRDVHIRMPTFTSTSTDMQITIYLRLT